MRHTYYGKAYKVVDGDTIKFDIDLGFGVHIRETFRLLNVNTPELRSKSKTEKKEAKRAKKIAENFVGFHSAKGPFDVIIETVKDRKGKYGRYLAYIWRDEYNLNDILREEGWTN